MKDFLSINWWMHGLNSSYHALEVSVDKRYSSGFTVSTAYAWSNNLDYVSRAGFGGSFGINNPFNFFFSRGNADMSRKHRFVNSFVWDLPGLKSGSRANAILGSWRLSGITTLQVGQPFNVGATNNPMAGAGGARADLVGSGYPVLDPGRSKGDRLAASVPGRGWPLRIPVRGLQPVERDTHVESGHRSDKPQLREDHFDRRRSPDSTDGAETGLVGRLSSSAAPRAVFQ